MPDLNEQDGPVASSSLNITTPPCPSADLVKKARVTQSIIEQLGELSQQAQISVLRAVSAFYEIEYEI